MEKSGILAHSLSLTSRIARYQRSIGIAGGVAALGMATAIAFAPDTVQSPRRQELVEQLEISGLQPVSMGDAGFLREERILHGDTMGAVLSRLGIQDDEAVSFIRSSPSTTLMHQQLVPGKIVTATTTAAGDLKSLHFPLNSKETALLVQRHGDSLRATELPLRAETHIAMKAAEIRSSLFAASDAADIPDGIAIQLAEIFAGEIDFHRDLRKGDRFSVVYEMQYLQGQPYRSGRILSAEFSNGDETHRAIWFEGSGKGGYYTAEGKSLRKAFLRSPLEFSRVTSGFAMRFHPIHREWRAHKGVDYGAPAGTRVRATGDGTVDFAGRRGGYGNLIVIKHAGNYSTAYAHLKGFAPGIRKGSRIAQGEALGYVGQTGWATGPHLHYEFRVNNLQVNPLAVNASSTIPLDVAQLKRFQLVASAQREKLDLLAHHSAAPTFE